MKSNYKVPSDRYGYVHHFKKVEDERYRFVPEQEWMPIYVTYNDDKSVRFIDTEGGPCIGVGFKTDEIEVVKIDNEKSDNSFVAGIYFTLKEIEKTED